ncbi:MotA/TolQ/ExbB proton channel family protein [Bacteriovoracaceae bacterium]|nr:MotA/TolQ/ExbB proton channel family protein [Bacteriovoracaceae bacterium]
MEANLDILKIILQAGIVVKTVLIVLILLSVYSWAIILYKNKTLKRIEQDNDLFLEHFKNHNSLTEINAKVSECPDSSYANIFKEGYDELQKINDKVKLVDGMNLSLYFSEHGTDSLVRAMRKGSNRSNETMDHKLSPLASISSVGPFIGLFGTVWGIINSFRGLASGGGTIEAVAPGIAEALVATGVGLLAAIPANWFFNIYSNRISIINSQMESFEQDFVNLVERLVFTQVK